MAISGGNSKRTFKEIRNKILLCFSKGQLTVNEIAKQAGINWKTVNNHLIYLTGRGFVKEAFSSPYVRIYELTPQGKDFILANISRKLKIEDNRKKAIVNTSKVSFL
ncbi:ArsR family transcriptional regulator [Candidatus Woesearchaeota archaeon]|nr:ArsR family transcriptional regulator [Candidatus Woesearchaeota archaeon]